MNDGKKTFIDIINVSLSNIVVLMAGVLVGFLLPKVVGVTDYGYYKTYTLYATYVGMFHFGIIDGIYLEYGGKEYRSLERDKFRFYTRAFSIVEIAMSIILLFISFFFMKGEYRFIFSFLSAYLLFHNITGYYQGISQATSRFAELSSRNIIQSVLICMAVVLMWVAQRVTMGEVTYRTYIVFYTIIIAILTAWYMYTYKDITIGLGGYSCWKDVTRFIAIGFPLMLANLCSSLILTLDRQFVNILFDTETYAIYAFAYNMLSLVTTATSAISTVLYPKLKQIKESTLERQYSNLSSAVTSLVFCCLMVYFPLAVFVNWYLPKYSDSLIIFRIIFPGLAISSAITIVMHNYYKALGINLQYFVKSIIALIVSGIANYIAYIIFKSTYAISIASIITLLFWYLLVEHYFIIRFQVRWLKNYSYLIIMMGAFYAITSISNYYLAGIMYGIVCIVITLLFNKDAIRSLVRH